MRNKSAIKTGILTGALLIAGLLFVYRDKTGKLGPRNLKPSQLDFIKSNRIQPLIFSEGPAPEPTAEAKRTELQEKELKSWTMLEEILSSKNDNDPRLDSELKSMSVVMHEALFEKYESLPMENRNGRGLLVFLVARDLKTAADAEFLRKVYQESPCTDFENCNNVGSDEPHFSGINQTSLNYPQLAGLYQIEARLAARPEILKTPDLRDGIQGMLKQAAGFPVPVVQKKAEEIRARFGL